MKTIINKAWLVIAGCALLAACSSVTPTKRENTSTATQLFTLEPTPDRATLKKNATGYLASLLADPENQEITLIKADLEVVSNTHHALAVTLPSGKTALFQLRRFSTITPGFDGWIGYVPSAWKQAHPSVPGEIDYDPLYALSLVRVGEKLVGRVLVDGQPYRIDSVSPGQHVLIKVDESKDLPDAKPLLPGATASSKAKAATTPYSEIDVMFVTTNQLRAKKPNNRAELTQALNDANQSMQASQTPITFRLVGFYDANYDEGGKTLGQQFSELTTGTPTSADILKERNALRADLVVVYSAKYEPGSSGIGVILPGKSNAVTAIISQLYSLTHELGHNLGIHHDRYSDPGAVNPNYARGWTHDIYPGFHTIMGYGCARTSPCAPIPEFSDPMRSLMGIPLGDPAAGHATRRLNETRDQIANIYPLLPVPPTFKKIRSVQRKNANLPACLAQTRDGIAFVKCEDDPGEAQTQQRYWEYQTVGIYTSIRNYFATGEGWKPCLKFEMNSRRPDFANCPATAAEARQDKTGWYRTAGQIIYSDVLLSACLTAEEGNNTPTMDFCRSNTNQQWETIP